MVEVINNRSDEGSSSAPWAIVAIVLVVVGGALAWFFLGGRAPQAAAPQQPNINVEIPVPQLPGGAGGEANPAP